MIPLRTSLVLLAACLAGGGTAVGVASGKDGRDGDDDGTTTAETTNTTTTPAPSRAPRVEEIEADAVSGGRFRLRAELAGRVTSVRFTYRSRTVRGRRTSSSGDWSRVVRARGGDRRGSTLTIRVRACNGSRCVTRTGRDEAGGG